MRQPTAAGVMAPPSERSAPTAGARAPRPPGRPGHSAGPKRLAGISLRVRRAENWSIAILRVRTGIAPRASMTRPHAGENSRGRSSCRSRPVSSPAHCLKSCARWAVRSSTAWTTCSCSPLRRPDRPARWPPIPSAGRVVWWASCTPGPAPWPPIRMSLPASLGGPGPREPAVARAPLRCLARACPRALPTLPGHVHGGTGSRGPLRSRAAPGVAQGLRAPLPTGGHRH